MSNEEYDKISLENFLKENPQNHYEEDELDELDDSYEQKLDKEIEENCDFNEYVDKLEVEEKTYSDLLKLEKAEIIEFKDYQIKKYKAYINSLEKEKQDLIENFKETTNVLLEKIKEIEEKKYGERPQTAMIMNDIKNNPRFNTYSLSNNTTNYSTKPTTNLISNSTIQDNDDKVDEETERCVKCKQYFTKLEFSKHSLLCLRKPMFCCKICKENINDNEKENHIFKFRNTDEFIQSIKQNNNKTFDMYIGHGYDVSVSYDDNGYYPIHYIAEFGNVDMIKTYLKKKLLLKYCTNSNDNALVSLYIL